ncbi:MAG: hypothetical protein WC511_01750 [Candidatus Pacearchaeota archaeon]
MEKMPENIEKILQHTYPSAIDKLILGLTTATVLIEIGKYVSTVDQPITYSLLFAGIVFLVARIGFYAMYQALYRDITNYYVDSLKLKSSLIETIETVVTRTGSPKICITMRTVLKQYPEDIFYTVVFTKDAEIADPEVNVLLKDLVQKIETNSTENKMETV